LNVFMLIVVAPSEPQAVSTKYKYYDSMIALDCLNNYLSAFALFLSTLVPMMGAGHKPRSLASTTCQIS